jgi:hypothetical protein
LSGVAEPGETGEIVKRALEYPYANPGRSFVQVGARTLELPADGPNLAGRAPLLAYGANAAPLVLARKLAALPELPLPLILAELDGFDVVYSAHISPYGAVPATLQRSPGTVVMVFVAYPTPEQLTLLTATEPNYDLRSLTDVSCLLDTGDSLGEIAAYISRHGCLLSGDSEIALATTIARRRTLPQMSQAEVQELVRDRPIRSFRRTQPFFDRGLPEC